MSAVEFADGATTALMAGIHCCQEVTDLSSAHLADHEPVGTHAQRLTDQISQADRSSELGVGRLDPHDMWMVGQQLLESSTMTIRSCGGTNASNAASRVVLPEPVPPLIRNASLAPIIRARSCAVPGSQ